jgi:pyrimidine and pyridine-specific 5'-nucleotidase
MTVSEASTSVHYSNPELLDDKRPGSQVELPYGYGPLPHDKTNKRFFFFDIDNCLYEKSTKIHDMMQVKIHQFFKDHLNLNDEDAHVLHIHYYREYGLALEGLVRNHKVDALEYNSRVDDAIDLKSVLLYNQQLRDMLIRIKQSGKFDYFWLVTNAYRNHALRVISFLGLGDLFDGLTFCDYSQAPIICKPKSEYFYNVMEVTNLDNKGMVLAQQYYIDDSEINVKAAHDLGFGHIIHFVEDTQDLVKLSKKPDFSKYYGNGDNSDPTKIQIIKSILDIEKVIQ